MGFRTLVRRRGQIGGRRGAIHYRALWNSRQRGRALWQATRALFEPLRFQNGLGGRRGEERDQRSCGVSLIAAGNNARGELGVVLNRGRQRASEFDGWLSQDFADLIESDLNVAAGNACVQHFRGRK